MKMNRDDIQIISRHSNWSEKSIENTLKREIYNDKPSWLKFLRLFFLSLGVSFTTAGILFFFAYNWADLHKFIKIGLVEGVIVITTCIVLFSKLSLESKNILLTGASILVGVLFAVFGQIYQTGANAYDFFLGWTIFISLWVIISNFAPLWLVFIVLINTTLLLYSEQVAHDWTTVSVYTLLFTINTIILMTALIIEKKYKEIKPPFWFNNLIALTSISYSTIGVSMGIVSKQQLSFLVLIVMVIPLYIFGIKYALKKQIAFYLAIISLSSIIIFSTLLLKLSSDLGMFFFIGIFVIVSITIVIKNLIRLQKIWDN